jgi:hypothetical protein
MSNKTLNFISKILSVPDHEQIMKGQDTHNPALLLSARGTTQYVSEEVWCNAVLALLPPGYAGNLRSEVRNLYRTAHEKQLGWDSGYTIEYDPGQEGPVPLGCTKDDRFAFLHQRLNVLKIKTAKQLANAAELLDLASSRFWRKIAPNEDTQSGYSSHTIADALIQASLERGKIDPTRIRGIGVWRERGDKIVKNFSGPIPERGWFIYTRFEEFETMEGKAVDPNSVLSWLRRFNWKNPDYAILLFGWLAYAPICGVLRQRPHLFLTGQKNTGKTTLLQGIEALLDPLTLKFDGSTTTEAGIRQKLEENASPIIIDEFEAGNLGTRRRIVDLARSAFSANAAGVKGTPSGHHMEFLITSTFLFAGINVLRGSAADSSRMFVIELLPHDNSQQTRNVIETELQGFMEGQTDWCLKRIDQAEVTLAAILAFEPLMPSIDSRAKRNLSIAFGAAFTALHDRIPTPGEIETWIENYKSLIVDHSQAHEQNDPQDCLSFLLSHSLGHVEGNVWKAVANAAKPSRFAQDNNPNNTLQSYGLRVEDGMLFVSDNHGYLMRIFQGSKWPEGGWKAQFLRLPDAIEARKYFQGLQQRCVGIPLENLNLEESSDGCIPT